MVIDIIKVASIRTFTLAKYLTEEGVSIISLISAHAHTQSEYDKLVWLLDIIDKTLSAWTNKLLAHVQCCYWKKCSEKSHSQNKHSVCR